LKLSQLIRTFLLFGAMTSPAFADILWVDPSTGHEWLLKDGVKNWQEARTLCTASGSGWQLPSRFLSERGLKPVLTSFLGDALPTLSYRKDGNLGDTDFNAKVFWLQEYEDYPAYGNTWFVMALIQDEPDAFINPHFRRGGDLFSVICFRR
jgi:hypothetical protein